MLGCLYIKPHSYGVIGPGFLNKVPTLSTTAVRSVLHLLFEMGVLLSDLGFFSFLVFGGFFACLFNGLLSHTA